MRVIIKIEVREITFGHAVITLNFFLIFCCRKIASFWPLKVRFEGKNRKDMADDGNKAIFLIVEPYSPDMNWNATHISSYIKYSMLNSLVISGIIPIPLHCQQVVDKSLQLCYGFMGLP